MFPQNVSTSEGQVDTKEEEQESHRKHSTIQFRKINIVFLTLNFLRKRKTNKQKPQKTKIKPRDNDKPTLHKMLRFLKYFPIFQLNVKQSPYQNKIKTIQASNS